MTGDDAESVTLWLPGMPVAWSRVATRGFQRYTPEPYRGWLLAAGGLVAAEQRRHHRRPLEDPVAVALRVFPNGIGVVITPARESARPKGIRGDLDNYGKAVADALEGGGVLRNDRQIEASTLAFYPHPGGPP